MMGKGGMQVGVNREPLPWERIQSPAKEIYDFFFMVTHLKAWDFSPSFASRGKLIKTIYKIISFILRN